MINDRLNRKVNELLAELGVAQEGSQMEPGQPRNPGTEGAARRAEAREEREEDELRSERLLHTGTANQCLDEARVWIEYYIASENEEVEPLSTAMALITRAQHLITSQPPSLPGRGPEESEGERE